jgi:hypothetical protein
MTGPTSVYSGRTTNWPVIAVAVVGGLALVGFGRPWAGPWPGMLGPLALVVAALALGLVTSTSLRVTTGPRGVQIRCGVFGWPRFVYPRERIAAAEVVAVSIWHSWNAGINWTPRGGWVTVGVTDPDVARAALGFAATGGVRR